MSYRRSRSPRRPPLPSRRCRAADAKGVRTKLGFTFRYSPAIRQIKRWIDDGTLGEIFHIHGFEQNSQFLDPDFPLRQVPPDAARDRLIPAAIIGYGSHLVDLMRWLGGEFGSVASTMRNFVPERVVRGTPGRQRIPIEDGTVAIVEYANGAQGFCNRATLRSATIRALKSASMDPRVRPSRVSISEFGVAETLHYATADAVEFRKIELTAGASAAGHYLEYAVAGTLLPQSRPLFRRRDSRRPTAGMHVLRRREEPGDHRRHHRGAFRAAMGRSARGRRVSAGRDAGVDGGSLAEAFLSHHLTYRPVDATFMGLEGHDALLPPCAAGAEAAEKAGLAALKRRLYAEPEPQTSGERLDRRIVASELEIAAATLDVRPRFLNPAWYSGEAAFSIISLLLPQSEPTRREAVHHRLQAIPDFLADARSRLAGGEAPRSWTERAQREAAAFGRFLTGDLRLHPDWDERWGRPAALAERALREFVERIDNLPHCDPACGEAHLAMLMRVGHALDLTPSAALQIAEEAFDRLGEELAEMAAQIDPTRPWQKQIEALADQHPASNEAVLETYRSWHAASRT